ncbi:hypothetical protein RIF29_06907 [Crotalaria pallida]|uniref:Kinetochore protein SPC25 n=1 Tax=Crotalaria pallida TaxID=3830 RepID=A0AAN9J3M3_CROPI
MSYFSASYLKSLQSEETAQFQALLFSQIFLFLTLLGFSFKAKLIEAEADLVKITTSVITTSFSANVVMNINSNNPNEEYFFTIRLENNKYTLLSCEPSLEGTQELIHELNKTYRIVEFVRVMRKKFEEAVAQAVLSRPKDVDLAAYVWIGHEESAFISAFATVLSMSSAKSDSPTKEKEHQVEPTDIDTNTKNQNVQKRGRSALLSPVSASSVHQSPRLKVLSENKDYLYRRYCPVALLAIVFSTRI